MQKGKIRVLHILTDTNIGGAGTLLYNMLRCADTAQFDYTVALPSASRLVERLSALPCRVVELPVGRDRSCEPRALGAYIRLLRKLRPDILHTHAALTARLGGWLCRVRVRIQTRHCVFPLTAWQRTGMARLLFRWGSKLLSHRVIAVAEAAKQNLVELGMDPRQITVIINGVLPMRKCEREEVEALRRRLGLNETHFVVGMPARLELYKGQQTVLRAALLCRTAAPEMRFVFIGDGGQIDRYRDLARALGIEDMVRFVGFAEDVAPYYALMDVNLNASYGTETSSLSLSEGMSVGVPAVASRYGGNPRMIVEGENGLLFPPEDPRALADTLLRLRNDAALRARLSAGAKQHYLTRFTAAAMVHQLEELYREALGVKREWSLESGEWR